MKDYSIFDSSGLTQTIKYDINYYWTGNGSLLTKSYTNLKFLIIRLSNTVVNSLNMNVVIKDKSDTTLDKGDDYVLFYQEELISGSPAYSWPFPISTKPYSPWLDCANQNSGGAAKNYFALAQSGTNNGLQNGAWDSNGYIKRLNTANAIYQYLAIGINRGKTVKSINISYA